MLNRPHISVNGQETHDGWSTFLWIKVGKGVPCDTILTQNNIFAEMNILLAIEYAL